MRPHRRKPMRLPCPWDSPGKNAGVGCHFLLHCMKVKSEVAQSCPTLSDPIDCSLPDSSVHGIFQARVLEWVARSIHIVSVHLLPPDFASWSPYLITICCGMYIWASTAPPSPSSPFPAPYFSTFSAQSFQGTQFSLSALLRIDSSLP